jgi:PAS domain S-box-containing protein
MSAWFDELPIEVFRAWAKNAGVPLMISGTGSEIYWVNQAFEEWSGYTLGELRAMGWKKLSNPDDSLEADLKAMAEVVDGYRTHYTVQKYYIPKNEKPQAGELTAVRYPSSGPIQFFLCTWQPLKNGTAAAFEMAVRHIGEVDKTVSELVKQVNTLTHRSEDEDWVLSTIRIAKRYPKLAAMFVAIVLSVFGLNNLLELMQRLYAVGVPVPEKVQQTDVMQSPMTPEMPEGQSIFAIRR